MVLKSRLIKSRFLVKIFTRLEERLCDFTTWKLEDNFSSAFINAKERYIAYMIKEFDHLKGFDKPFVYDCGNGVAGVVVQDIFKGLGLYM
jgi:phosphomannomutase